MPEQPTDKIREVLFALQDDLDSVCRKFKNPKVTLVVRSTELIDGDVIIGNDDLDLAIKAINNLKDRKPMFKQGD